MVRLRRSKLSAAKRRKETGEQTLKQTRAYPSGRAKAFPQVTRALPARLVTRRMDCVTKYPAARRGYPIRRVGLARRMDTRALPAPSGGLVWRRFGVAKQTQSVQFQTIRRGSAHYPNFPEVEANKKAAYVKI